MPLLEESKTNRSHYRFQVLYPAEVKKKVSGRVRSSQVVDISKNGMKLASTCTYEVGDILELTFYLATEGRTMTVTATVRYWEDNTDIIGLYDYFIGLEVSEEQQTLLEEIKQKIKLDQSSPAQVRQRFDEAVYRFLLMRLRIVYPFAIILWFIFLGLDYLAYPQYLKEFFILRVVGAIPVIAIYGLSFTRALQKNISDVSIFGIVVAATALNAMVAISDGSNSHYYAGINLTILVMLISNTISYLRQAGYGLIVMIGYAIAVAINDGIANVSNFVIALFYMMGTVLFCAFLARTYNSQFKREFEALEDVKKGRNKLAAAYQTMKNRADLDELTQVYNRRAFMRLLSWRIDYAQEHQQSFVLVVMDIDRFKEINDRYGHVAGDHAIQCVVRTLEGIIRQNSYVGRYGGDEFLIIFDQSEQEELRQRLQELCDAVRDSHFECEGEVVPLSASFGAAKYDPDKELDVKGIIDLADSALRHVKETGRGNVHIV